MSRPYSPRNLPFSSKKVRHYYSGMSLLSITAFLLALIGLFVWGNQFFGVFPFGPKENRIIHVTKTYVDVTQESKESTSSHYMVGTSEGIFEVDNSLFLGIFNADEIYGQLEGGKTYSVITKGNKVVNWFTQEYPRIIEVLGEIKKE